MFKKLRDVIRRWLLADDDVTPKKIECLDFRLPTKDNQFETTRCRVVGVEGASLRVVPTTGHGPRLVQSYQAVNAEEFETAFAQWGGRIYYGSSS